MKVTLPHDPMWFALEWALKNCPSFTHNSAETTTDNYGLSKISTVNYYFKNEQDAVIFSLRWL